MVLITRSRTYSHILAASLVTLILTGCSNVQRNSASTPPTSAPSSHSINAETMYDDFCGMCHQPDGKGVEGTYPSLVANPKVLGDAKLLAALVLDGGEEQNMMPAFRDVLTEEQAAAILSYVRSQWGNEAPPVSVEDIRKRAVMK